MTDRIAKLKSFLEENPHDSFVQHALALEYVKMGDDNTAKTIFENLLSQDAGYVGSYYHIAKLMERMDNRDEAIRWYELGMLQAKEKGEQHAYNELRSAYEELIY